VSDPTAVTMTDRGLVVDLSGQRRVVAAGDGVGAMIDRLFSVDDVETLVAEWFDGGAPDRSTGLPASAHAPIGTQEVWAAGVTYRRSRDARMVESHDVGADTFYDMVYEADRPELFFKATPHRVVGHGGAVRIRTDSTWDVPEPEFTLAISRSGRIIGYTIGNDMSSRSIEGDNPLYLPQAKVYSSCAALGPRIVLGELPPPTTEIRCQIEADGAVVFEGCTALDRITRPFEELVDHLFRDNDFPAGVFLMTGTGIVPPDDFTLEPGHVVRITIDPVGTLVNHVVRGR
jgi:2-dehydro-3-deoxy-D-arabinonate dehydratase